MANVSTGIDTTRVCPVCLDCVTNQNGLVFAFGCVHFLCAACDDKLLLRQDLRCPVCRAPRTGYTEQQAEAAATALHSDSSLTDEQPEQHFVATAAIVVAVGGMRDALRPLRPASEILRDAHDALNNLDSVSVDQFRELLHCAVTESTERG